LVVLEDVQTEAVGEIYGLVGTAIVHKYADVNEVGQLPDCDLQSLFRIVGGHDDRDALSVNHLVKDTNSLPEMLAAAAQTVAISGSSSADCSVSTTRSHVGEARVQIFKIRVSLLSLSIYSTMLRPAWASHFTSIKIDSFRELLNLHIFKSK
jgi:hypothetical protein